MLEATIVFSVAAFVGNFGVALTGFGMAIFFLFVYNIGEYAGAMDTDGCDRCGIKDAVFYQTIALFAAIPVLIYRARDVIREHRNKTLLMTFIPATIVGTPVGNFLQEHLPSDIVRLILGIAITFALVNTLYRQIIQMECYKRRTAKESKHEGEEGSVKNAEDGHQKEDIGEITPFPIGVVKDKTDVMGQEENQPEKVQSQKSHDINESDEVKEISATADSNSVKENTDEIIAAEEGLVQDEAKENETDSKEETKTQEQNQDEIDTEMLAGRPLKIWGTISGFLSGFLGGLIGVRGPPLMVFFLYFSFPKNVVRANSILILLVNVTIRVVYYIIEDASGSRTLPWFEGELWYLYLCLIIFGVLGVPIGQYVASRVSQNQFKLIIALMLLMSGVSNMIKGSIDIAKGT